MRRILIICIVFALNSIPVAPSGASESARRVQCQPTSAVAHTPMKVPIPTILTQVPKTFTIFTNCGNIEVTTVGNKAPITLSVLTALANDGFYDNSLCHRITTSGLWVLQCGDPTASGSGGPPFTYRDENLPALTPNNYPAGTVAMANSGPNTNQSQFFICYKDTTLGPNYTIWGHITSGLGIVQYVAAAGVVGGGTDGPPAQKIALLKVKVGEVR